MIHLNFNQRVKQILSLCLFSIWSFCGTAAQLVGAKPITVSVNKDLSSSLRTLATKNTADLSEMWYSYQVEMEPGNGVPCCYHGDIYSSNHEPKRKNSNQMACVLAKQMKGWGNHWSANEENQDSKTLDLFFQVKNGQPTKWIFAGDSCPVDASGVRVTRFSDVSQAQSVKFLSKQIANIESDIVSKNSVSKKTVSKKSVSNSDAPNIKSRVLAALALHKGEEAFKQLVTYSDSRDKQVRHNAIFWLGEARNQPGFEVLATIIDEKQLDKHSLKHTVFAISQNDYPAATDKLISLAEADEVQAVQAEAIFWLAQTRKEQALPIIEKLLENGQSAVIRKKAIFSLSQIKTDLSWQLLLDVALDAESLSDRLEAIFWLSQDRHRNPSPVLLGLVNRDPSSKIKEKAIFSLSQLPQELSTPALLNLLKNSPNKLVKKKALFWLGQSSDPRAFEALENILTASIE